MWPTIATSGASSPSPATRAIEEPMRSVSNSAKPAASRQTLAAGAS